MIDQWREMGESLSRHGLRTVLTLLSVAWGTFVLVVLLGAGVGLQNNVKWQFRDDANCSARDLVRQVLGRRVQVVPDDLDGEPCVNTSCGYVLPLGTRAAHLTIAQDVHPEGDVNGVTHIPMRMVLSVHFVTKVTDSAEP